MAIWDKLKTELDRAGKVAQSALDEGKLRLEAMRARQLADRAAQALGYAVYRSRKSGQELDPETYARLSSALAGHEAEVERFEEKLREVAREARKGAGSAPGAGSPSGASAGPTSSRTASDAAPSSSSAGTAGQPPHGASGSPSGETSQPV